MQAHSTRRAFAIAMLGLCMGTGAAFAAGTDVTLVGVFPNKAVLVIGKGAPRTVAAGQTVDGVTLVSVGADSVTIQADGTKRMLHIGQVYAAGGAGNRVVLAADRGGHFFTDARVNGGLVRMMVDTGASVVALPARDADRIGLNYLKGSRVAIATANGTTEAWKVKVDTVSLGDITVNNVDAVVAENGLSMPLLGMSVLSRLNMQREGDTMTLSKRF